MMMALKSFLARNGSILALPDIKIWGKLIVFDTWEAAITSQLA